MRKDKIPVSLLQWEKALGMFVFSNILPDNPQLICEKVNAVALPKIPSGIDKNAFGWYNYKIHVLFYLIIIFVW